IENYSRHILGKKPGEAPNTLLDFFPDDFLMVIDESHIAIPQIRGMYEGDRSRKQTLVDYGFRLPSALDNRPLRFEEFEAKVGRVIFTSATPSPYERKASSQIVEQIIRPTGLVIIIIAYKVFYCVIGEKFLELVTKLGCKCLIGSQNQCWKLNILYHICYRISLSGTSNSQ
ncbi:unnamed protein product, partial [marine sediment metagenome]